MNLYLPFNKEMLKFTYNAKKIVHLVYIPFKNIILKQVATCINSPAAFAPLLGSELTMEIGRGGRPTQSI